MKIFRRDQNQCIRLSIWKINFYFDVTLAQTKICYENELLSTHLKVRHYESSYGIYCFRLLNPLSRTNFSSFSANYWCCIKFFAFRMKKKESEIFLISSCTFRSTVSVESYREATIHPQGNLCTTRY